MNLTVIGAGKMGEALARGMLRAALLSPAELTFTDIAVDRVQALAAEIGAVAMTDNRAAVREAEIVLLAVKPNTVAGVCAEIAEALPAGCSVVSIAAGISMRHLESALQRDDIFVARAMPNVLCLIGEGAIGIAFQAKTPVPAQQEVVRMLSTTGVVEVLPESLMDAVTGLSGSGPAYIAVLIEAMADGGVLMGLPRAQAQQLAMQTVLGSAKLLQQTQQHPAVLKDAVSSPGGTTIAGLAALEDGKFRATIISAIKAATLRSRALSGE